MNKTANFNLIILDESGSMHSSTNATIAGCNETLNVIRSMKEKHGERNEYFVSIYAFQSGTVQSRYLTKNRKIDEQKDITNKDYCPGGMTPLLDAVGSTLADLKMVAETHEDSTAMVTIITDGYENASTEYTYEHVAKMIEELKELGWVFNFIGSNIDVEKVGRALNIDKGNCMSYTSTEAGTRSMMRDLNLCVGHICNDQANLEAEFPEMSREEKIKARKERAKGFFKR